MITFAPVEPCPHGLPRDQYCYKCTYVERPSTQVLEPRTITLVLDIECEPHWTDDELNRAVVSYLTRYVDEPGYQPETYYIREVYSVGHKADHTDGRVESQSPV